MPEGQEPREIKKIPWYKRKEIQGLGLMILSYSPEIINAMVEVKLLKDYTAVAKLALPLGVVLTALGLRKGYKADNLPSGLAKLLDKIPDAITGEKGSGVKYLDEELPSGLAGVKKNLLNNKYSKE